MQGLLTVQILIRTLFESALYASVVLVANALLQGMDVVDGCLRSIVMSQRESNLAVIACGAQNRVCWLSHCCRANMYSVNGNIALDLLCVHMANALL